MIAEPFLIDRLLTPGGIRSVLQPVFDLSRGTPVPWGVECLSRGPIGTGAEGAALLFEYVRFRRREAEVDKICITNALQAVSHLRGEARVVLNVHAATLARNPSFAPWLLRQAFESRVAPSRLILEVVEATTGQEIEPLARTLAPARAAGVRVSIDDVGTGASTLRLVVELAPDYLKIDRFFLPTSPSDARRLVVMESLVSLAKGVGANVIAEGVESPAQMGLIFSSGIRLVQGFAMCEPLPLEELAARTPDLFERPAVALAQSA
jgi:EAL domain-containing protein (putative c-di-GMP-specific phosphodiesterase class I)